MSTFTITLNEWMEDMDVDTVDDAVPHAAEFGLAGYPIFEPAYRDVLNRKIIARFWNREIGHEDELVWRLRMDTRMREIMPRYNQLYLSEQIKFDPMRTMDITTVMNGEDTSTNTSTAHSTAKDIGNTTTENITNTTNTSDGTKDAGSRTVSSVMPQNQLSGNGDYADGAQDANSTAKEHTTGTVNATNTENSDRVVNTTQDANATENGKDTTDRTSHTAGYQALPSQLLMQYRDTILNIDLDILGELERLFMAVTSDGDEYFYDTNDEYHAFPYWIGY